MYSLRCHFAVSATESIVGAFQESKLLRLDSVAVESGGMPQKNAKKNETK